MHVVMLALREELYSCPHLVEHGGGHDYMVIRHNATNNRVYIYFNQEMCCFNLSIRYYYCDPAFPDNLLTDIKPRLNGGKS